MRTQFLSDFPHTYREVFTKENIASFQLVTSFQYSVLVLEVRTPGNDRGVRLTVQTVHPIKFNGSGQFQLVG